jgi:hypothetical protein
MMRSGFSAACGGSRALYPYLTLLRHCRGQPVLSSAFYDVSDHVLAGRQNTKVAKFLIQSRANSPQGGGWRSGGRRDRLRDGDGGRDRGRVAVRRRPSGSIGRSICRRARSAVGRVGCKRLTARRNCHASDACRGFATACGRAFR